MTLPCYMEVIGSLDPSTFGKKVHGVFLLDDKNKTLALKNVESHKFINHKPMYN